MTSAILEIDLPPEHPLRQIMDTITAHPEVREPLLRVLLTDELQALPEKVDALQDKVDTLQESFEEFRDETRAGFRAVNARIDETNRAMQEQFRAVNARIDETNRAMQEQFRAVNARIDETNRAMQEQFRAMQEQFRAVNEHLTENTRAIRSLQGHSGRLRGISYEDLCRRVIGVILDGWLDGPVLADLERINLQLLRARRNGDISRDEYNHGLLPDIIAREYDDESQTGRLAVVEATVTFNRGDLEIAARRAAIIAKATGQRVDAFIATHHEWPPAMDAVAMQLGVAIIRYESPEHADD